MSSVLLFANNAASTLAAPITNTATSLTVSSGTGALFPIPATGQAFKLTLVSASNPTLTEIVLVAAVSGDFFAITRAQEGTTALNWNAGDFAYNLNTAGTMQAFVQAANAATSFYQGTDNGTANAVNVPSLTPALTTPSAGQIFIITKGAQGNTSSVSMAINGGTAYSVVFKNGAALSTGDWPAYSAALLYFTGSVYQYVSNQSATPVTSLVYGGTDTGSPGSIVAQAVPPISALVPFMQFTILIGSGNTNTSGSTSLNISGLGAHTVLRPDTGGGLGPYNILGSEYYTFLWTGSNFILQNPAIPTSSGFTNTYYVGAGSPLTITIPLGKTQIGVQMWGGGGGGGAGGSGGAGGGAGGGGYVAGIYTVVPGQQYGFTTGAGGAAGSGTTTGGTGGSSYIYNNTTSTTIALANGGTGGGSVATGSGAAGSGGTASGGTQISGIAQSGYAGAAGSEIGTTWQGGPGAPSGFNGTWTPGGLGYSGSFPGNGGGGSASNTTPSNAGANGFIIMQI